MYRAMRRVAMWAAAAAMLMGAQPALADCLPWKTAGPVIAKNGLVPAKEVYRNVLTRTGGKILLHKVAIRPGKPLLCARLPGGPLLFGLPGNPMAVAVGLRFFVLPAIRTMLGRASESFPCARTTAPIRKRESLTFFAKALARVTPEAVLEVTLLPGQESFRIAPLLRANCWAIVPDGVGDVRAGDVVHVASLLPAAFPGGS